MQLQGTYRQILRIALPIIISSLAQNIISVTDTAFMGRVGETELAAIGYISLFYLVLFMIGFSFTKGTQILIARRAGEGKKERIGEVVDNKIGRAHV